MIDLLGPAHMAAAGSEQPQSFSVLADGTLSAAVRLAVWSPVMDLLALLTLDGQVSLHRLTLMRLWTATPPSAVSAMCWSPDGRQLVLGCVTGAVSFLDVEAGDIKRHLQICKVAITGRSHLYFIF